MAARCRVDKCVFEHGYTCRHFLKCQKVDFHQILEIWDANTTQVAPKCAGS